MYFINSLKEERTMEKLTLQQLINQTGEALVQAGASSYYQKVFKTLTKLITFRALDLQALQRAL